MLTAGGRSTRGKKDRKRSPRRAIPQLNETRNKKRKAIETAGEGWLGGGRSKMEEVEGGKAGEQID